MKKETLQLIEVVKNQKKSEIEKIVNGKIIYQEGDNITFSMNENPKIKYIADFSKKKVSFKNIAGSALMGFAHLTTKKADYLMALYNQYKSLNHTFNIIKSVNVDELKKASFEKQKGIFDDENETLNNL